MDAQAAGQRDRCRTKGAARAPARVRTGLTIAIRRRGPRRPFGAMPASLTRSRDVRRREDERDGRGPRRLDDGACW